MKKLLIISASVLINITSFAADKELSERAAICMMSELFVNFSREPDENYFKTKEGICLLIGVLGRPILVGTPLGAYFFDTTKYKSNDEKDNEKYQDIISKNFKLSFCCNLGEKEKYIKFYLENVSHEISKEDLDKYRNTDAIIFSDQDLCSSVYRVERVGEIELPKTVGKKG